MQYRIAIICLVTWIHSLGAMTALQKKQELVATQEQQETLGSDSTRIARYDELVKKSNAFDVNVCKFSTIHNLIKNIAGDDKSKKAHIAEQADSVRVIMHEKVREQLIPDFLAYKRTNGSAVEKALYDNMSVDGFINRLIEKRPMMFMNGSDNYLLRNKQRGSGGFEKIGKHGEEDPLILKDYLSYDEMQIAALIGVSVPTYFINDGDRNNKAQKGAAGSYQEEGIYVGLVGARFERPGLMEWQHIIVTEKQNTSENGYGAGGKKSLLNIWKSFYDDELATYKDLDIPMGSKRYFNAGEGKDLFDCAIYRKRMRMVLEPFFLEANARGAAASKKVYCHVVGLGTGVWAVNQARQEIEIGFACTQILSEHLLSNIADIDFSYYGESIKLSIQLGDKNKHITLHFSKRNPAAKLMGADEGKLLVAMYAWDGNAYPGNEYWIGALTASGDPAAACCSTIPELQNPLINDALLKAKNHASYGKK